MLKYELNFDLKEKMNRGQLLVDSYSVDAAKKTITVDIKDTIENKYLKVVFRDAEVVNETFDIIGKTVYDLVIADYVKYFKSHHFSGLMLIVKNQYDENAQDFAILSKVGG